MSTLKDLVGACHLHAIDAVQASAVRLDMAQLGDALDHTPAHLDVHIEMQQPPAQREGWLTFLITVQGRVRRGPTEVGQLSATIRLAYQLQGAQPTEALSKSFGREVATHHAWPYLRERAHSLAVGIGFHLPPLPLRRLEPGLLP